MTFFVMETHIAIHLNSIFFHFVFWSSSFLLCFEIFMALCVRMRCVLSRIRFSAISIFLFIAFFFCLAETLRLLHSYSYTWHIKDYGFICFVNSSARMTHETHVLHPEAISFHSFFIVKFLCIYAIYEPPPPHTKQKRNVYPLMKCKDTIDSPTI